MTNSIHKNEKPTFEPEYFDRFYNYFGFSLRQINLPTDCQIMQSVEHGIVITFAWIQIVSRKVQILENSYIRVIDNGIRIKWHQPVITFELLTDLLGNIEHGVLEKL